MPTTFPGPTVNGIKWARFEKKPLDWSGVAVSHTYEDDGVSLSHTTSTPPVRWEVAYTGLTQAEADAFDTFNDTVKRSGTFDFTDKWGTTHSGVRIVSYERTHEGHRSWNFSVRFTLAKYY